MKILVYSAYGFDTPFLEEAARGKHQIVFTQSSLNETTAHLADGFDGVALFTSDNASAKVIEHFHDMGVRCIALRSVGYDYVDIQKAKEFEIPVANVPAYSPYAVAEHATALLLAVNRKLLQGQKLMSNNDFRLDALVGFDLYGKTIGVIGTGKIGASFAKIMHGFGCTVLAYDIQPDVALQKEINLRYTSFAEVCQMSDVVSVFCPLNEKTKHMFNKSAFALMKKGVVFINTARGAIVNTVDLLEALDSGIVSAAGLDVYEYEKPLFFYDHSNTQLSDTLFEKLRSYDTVLITGHQAFLTKEALSEIAKTTIDNFDQWSFKGFSTNDIH